MISAFRKGAVRSLKSMATGSSRQSVRAMSTGIPSEKDQATGLRREEFEDEGKGVTRFNRNALFVEKIGTKADPTLIPSMNPTRVVGCSGGCTEVSYWSFLLRTLFSGFYCI